MYQVCKWKIGDRIIANRGYSSGILWDVSIFFVFVFVFVFELCMDLFFTGFMHKLLSHKSQVTTRKKISKNRKLVIITIAAVAHALYWTRTNKGCKQMCLNWIIRLLVVAFFSLSFFSRSFGVSRVAVIAAVFAVTVVVQITTAPSFSLSLSRCLGVRACVVVLSLVPLYIFSHRQTHFDIPSHMKG